MVPKLVRERENGLFCQQWPGNDKNALPLVYLHGLGDSGLIFEDLFVNHILLHPGLANRHHMIPDLPSYGRSFWPDVPLALAEVADYVANWLVARRGLKSVILVGHSMGGIVALLLAERHPMLVRGVIDVEGNKSEQDCTFSGTVIGHAEQEFVRHKFREVCDTILLNEEIESQARRRYFASLNFCDPVAFYRNSEELVTLSRERDLAKRLSQLRCPVHYIAGAARGGASKESMKLIRAIEIPIPYTVVEAAGHWPFISQPVDFVEALSAILHRFEWEREMAAPS